MRLIVLGDIHGNIEAFNSVIEDVFHKYGKQIDGFIFLGDYCCDFLEGKECLEVMDLLKETFPIYVISGNRETGMVRKYYEAKRAGKQVDWSIETTMGPPLLSCERMTEEQLKYLSTLEESKIVSIPGTDAIYLQHKMPIEEEMRKKLKEKNVKIVLTAHVHESHIGEYGDFTLFNPGSVGLTDTGKVGASYGVMEWKNQHWLMQVHTANYNYEAAIHRVLENPILMQKCEHWGELLIASVQYGVNATSMYAAEKTRIAKLYSENPNSCDFSIGISPFGQNRYGNVGANGEHLTENIILGDTITKKRYRTIENGPKEEKKAPVAKWMCDIAYQNTQTYLKDLKEKNILEGTVHMERKF